MLSSITGQNQIWIFRWSDDYILWNSQISKRIYIFHQLRYLNNRKYLKHRRRQQSYYFHIKVYMFEKIFLHMGSSKRKYSVCNISPYYHLPLYWGVQYRHIMMLNIKFFLRTKIYFVRGLNKILHLLVVLHFIWANRLSMTLMTFHQNSIQKILRNRDQKESDVLWVWYEKYLTNICNKFPSSLLKQRKKEDGWFGAPIEQNDICIEAKALFHRDGGMHTTNTHINSTGKSICHLNPRFWSPYFIQQYPA